MTRLEDLQPTAAVRGILPEQVVTVVSVQWFGSEALELTYKGPTGRVANELLYRHDEPRLQVLEHGRPWSFDGDGHLFRLVSEAHRIRLAHLFDPVLAVHTSLVEPLPHQITAVYEAMLPRQPLRFLLADDPGAGKTIMAGLLIKELIARGDLQRCLIVCPGSLAEQWQDELYRRFHLSFEILTNDKLEASRTGNWFLENNLIIARLDKLSRNEDVQHKLEAPECRWDLVVCDEAHKLSATFFGGEVKYTKRYHLGQLLSGLTRHFLLMTATPHNGKEEDFQLFMALLDGDRFEGRFRDGVHQADTSDLMRRMVKENLLKFDGTPLFPERIAYTVPYKLSADEARLYKEVTDYVREEFNRAEALANDKRAGTVGFALTILQRRLASSPEAIYQSLHRRSERLQKRLRELELLQRGAAAEAINIGSPALDAEDVEDLEDAPDNEVEAVEEEILDQATAARTIGELKAEIATLGSLENLALAVRRSGEDRKWKELASLLSEIFATPTDTNDPVGADLSNGPKDIPPPKPSPHQKIVVFTEHRDTLTYLQKNVATLRGRPESVVVIHGGMGREERMKAQESFKHDPEVNVLIATDAAGEGINLQRAHLMVNYDLPWNPNRLEQRFGRIHRIGQTEVCHLWNLVAAEKAFIVTRRDRFISPQFVWLQTCLDQSLRPTDRQVFKAMADAANRMANTELDAALLAAEAEASGNSFLEYWALAAAASGNEIASRLSELALRVVQSRAAWRGVVVDALDWLAETAGTEKGVVTDAADDKAAWETATRAIRAEKCGEINLAELLQGLALRPKEPPADPGAVSLLTIHAAKGLEFDHVWLVGMAETVLPSWQSLQANARPTELEEERRNCFVAITRTRQTLVLTHARQYRGWQKQPSRFLVEMGVTP